MMTINFIQLFQRVYIRIGSEYDTTENELKKLDLLDLIREVAKANPNGDTKPLYNAKDDQFYEKRTKRFIVTKVNQYIAGIEDVFTNGEEMANYASLRQLNNMVRTFSGEKKRISCFGLVYLYVIYTLLEGKSSAADNCANYIVALEKLVHCYHQNHPNDEVVAFFVGCFLPIIQAIREKNTEMEANALPGRPCRHPKEIVE